MSDNVDNEKKNRSVEIKVPDHYKFKTDSAVWEELEKYIFDGFLTYTTDILDKTFTFKTLNHNEIRTIEFFRPAKASINKINNIYRATFISHSILFIDGENLLYNRPQHIRKLVKIITKIPDQIQDKILENLSILNKRASRLYPLVEIYVHENKSKFKWLQLEGTPVNSPIFTGIPGTDEIGMNYCQQTWMALSRLHDKREMVEVDWSNSKFIGSCFNGKGVRPVEEKDKARKDKERQDLDDLKMKVLYKYINRIDVDEEIKSEVKLPDGRDAIVEGRFRADSAEELADQLSASLSGEKDHHDLVIESKIKEFKDRSKNIDEYKAKLYSSPGMISDDQLQSGQLMGSSYVLGGKEEADARLNRMQKMMIKRMEEMRKITPSTIFDNKKENE